RVLFRSKGVQPRGVVVRPALVRRVVQVERLERAGLFVRLQVAEDLAGIQNRVVRKGDALLIQRLDTSLIEAVPRQRAAPVGAQRVEVRADVGGVVVYGGYIGRCRTQPPRAGLEERGGVLEALEVVDVGDPAELVGGEVAPGVAQDVAGTVEGGGLRVAGAQLGKLAGDGQAARRARLQERQRVYHAGEPARLQIQLAVYAPDGVGDGLFAEAELVAGRLLAEAHDGGTHAQAVVQGIVEARAQQRLGL